MRGNKRLRKRVASSLSVLLVADTHGEINPHIAAIASQCDVVVHAGDIGSAGVLERLHPSRGKICAVRGNNDTSEKWPVSDRRLLRRIPSEQQLKLPGGVLVVVHGDRIRPASIRHRRLRERYQEARAVVYGHTHRLVCDQTGRPWVINPGAAGSARTFGGASCVLLRVSQGRWRLYPYRPAR